jgi:hypothetical protein
MSLPPGQQVVAAQIYRNRSALIRRQLVASAVEEFDDIDDYDDPSDYIEEMTGLSLAAQRALGSDLAAYLYVASGDYADLDLDEVTGDAIREPEGLEHHWHIPFFSMGAALAAGIAFADAIAGARDAVERQATTDLSFVQSAVMHELAPRLESIVGFRRVTNGEECAFCDEASEQEYSTFDLAPLHPGCNCSVAPIFEDADPGEALNEYDRSTQTDDGEE